MTRVFFLIAMLFLTVGCDPNDEIIEVESLKTLDSKETIDLVLEKRIGSHGDEGDSMPDYD